MIRDTMTRDKMPIQIQWIEIQEKERKKERENKKQEQRGKKQIERQREIERNSQPVFVRAVAFALQLQPGSVTWCEIYINMYVNVYVYIYIYMCIYIYT